MMRNRESLIRLHKFHVDEKRRKLAELDLMLQEFRARERELEAQVIEEQKKAGISDVAHYAYPMFAKSVIRRRQNILASIEDIDRQIEAAKEELSAAFRELKKYETLEENRKRGHRKEAMRLEQAELDEVALGVYRRR
jgi:flagellar export protein FliJ